MFVIVIILFQRQAYGYGATTNSNFIMSEGQVLGIMIIAKYIRILSGGVRLIRKNQLILQSQLENPHPLLIQLGVLPTLLHQHRSQLLPQPLPRLQHLLQLPPLDRLLLLIQPATSAQPFRVPPQRQEYCPPQPSFQLQPRLL